MVALFRKPGKKRKWAFEQMPVPGRFESCGLARFYPNTGSPGPYVFQTCMVTQRNDIPGCIEVNVASRAKIFPMTTQ